MKASVLKCYDDQLGNVTNILPQGERFRGLEWVETTFSLEPRWTVDISLASIKRVIEAIIPSQKVEVSFLSQGAFNKVYNVQAGNEALILRVSTS